MAFNQRVCMVVLAAMWVACGGNNKGAPDASLPAAPPDAEKIDAPIDSPPPLPHHQYVVNRVNAVPTATAGDRFTDLGLDLGSPTSAALDGKVDNVLGQALQELAQFVDIQSAITLQIQTGATILLADIQAADLTTATTATLAVKVGADPVPAACASPTDPVCGQHLKGTATFSIAADSPKDTPLTGSITGGTFTSNAGELTLVASLGGTASPLAVHLVHARAVASGLTADGIQLAKIGGLVTQTELTTTILPVAQTAVTGVLTAAGCKPDGNPTATPACGCTAPTATTAVILGLIDGDDGTAKDCKISIAELLAFAPLKALLKLDSCSQATCAAPDSYSFGAEVTAVKASFPNL